MGCNRASHLWVEHANQTFLATMAWRVDHDFGFSRQRQILHVCVHTIPVPYHTIHAYDTYVCPHDWWWWGSRKTHTKHFERTDIMAHHRLEEHGINTTRLDTSTESDRHTQYNLMQSHAFMWHVWDLMWVIVQHPLRLPATQLAGREPWATSGSTCKVRSCPKWFISGCEWVSCVRTGAFCKQVLQR